MTPESSAQEQKRLAEDKALYPPFIVEGLRSLREQMRLENQTGKSHQSFSKVTDFIQLILSIWIISNKDYQERFWVRQEPPMLHADNYMETMETFLGTGEAVLDTSDYAVEMTPKQREMLEKFYDMMEDFEGDEDTPEDPGYGINDAAIIEDPKFDKCRRYARLVYEELSGDDLDAWEESRPKQAKPLDIARKEVTPAEVIAEKKKIYPLYLLECERKAIGDKSLYSLFVCLLFELWEMSNIDFQERFWVRKEYPIYDNKNCMKTVGKFFYDANTLMDNEKYITPKQSEILRKLYDMIKDFEKDPNKPENPGYGLNDAEIIAKPKWDKIRQYAKEVYEVLTSGEKKE